MSNEYSHSRSWGWPGGNVGVRGAVSGGGSQASRVFDYTDSVPVSSPSFKKIFRDLLAGPFAAERAGVVLSEEVAHVLRRLHECTERVLASAG